MKGSVVRCLSAYIHCTAGRPAASRDCRALSCVVAAQKVNRRRVTYSWHFATVTYVVARCKLSHVSGDSLLSRIADGRLCHTVCL